MTIKGNDSIFRAFRNRNYALYFSGQSISQIGTWMQKTSVSWLIYSLTHSPFMLGVSVFASQFPSFLLSIYGGILSDRYNRYKILLITQIASMIQAAVLAILILTYSHSVAWILALSVVLGIINAFDLPARQPMVHQMVNDKADLPNALALNSSMVNLAKLLGPALSGIILQQFGAGICFLLNALSFIAVLTSLLMMKLPPHDLPTEKKDVVSGLKESFQYLKQTPAIGMQLLILTMMSLLVLPYDTLLPVYAKTIFKGDAATFGYIRSSIGLGAIGGALFLASLKRGADLKMILLVNTILLGIGLMLFSHSTRFPVALIFAVIAGFGTMSQSTICVTIIQVRSAPHMRGRMMSFLAMAAFGMLPLGSLLVGTVSLHIGAPNALLCQGILALLIAAGFSRFLRQDRLDRKEKARMEDAETLVLEEI